jgi:hypothetical protein
MPAVRTRARRAHRRVASRPAGTLMPKTPRHQRPKTLADLVRDKLDAGTLSRDEPLKV